jgi:hypothetical protein
MACSGTIVLDVVAVVVGVFKYEKARQTKPHAD